jgi:hypothetical protein
MKSYISVQDQYYIQKNKINLEKGFSLPKLGYFGKPLDW